MKKAESNFQDDPEEEFRLAELHSLRILDTAAETRFDTLTAFAAELLDTPIALISLIDRNRQWFKSATGLKIPETSRDISFCTHAIKEKELLVIPDTKEDPRFRDNPLVTGDPYIRFYAGAVLRGPDGHALGTFCVLDRRARTPNPAELVRLQQFGKMVEWELAQDRLVDELLNKAEQRSFYDPNLGLPNRHLVLSRLDQAIGEAGERKQRLVVYVDIAGFDKLTQASGRSSSEELVRQVAARLAAVPGVQLGFAPRDKFILDVAVDDPLVERDRLLAALRSVFEQRYSLGELDYDITARAGVAVYPADGLNARTLLHNARAAMPDHTQADEALSVGFYSLDLDARLRRRFEIARRLKSAILSDRLTLAYQPIFEMKTGIVTSVEALARWTDPELGEVSPAEFVPVAEESRLILDLGDAVLRHVTAMQREWHSQGRTPLRISMNVSPQQLRQPDFARNLGEAIEGGGLQAGLLQLELTELALLSRHINVSRNLAEITRLGLALVLDDFGAGYASLSYVRRLPLKALKIDREFVEDIATSERDREIVSAIIAMGHALGIKILGEGVETREQLEVLRHLKCDYYQGFVSARPMPLSELGPWMDRQDSVKRAVA